MRTLPGAETTISSILFSLDVTTALQNVTSRWYTIQRAGARCNFLVLLLARRLLAQYSETVRPNAFVLRQYRRQDRNSNYILLLAPTRQLKIIRSAGVRTHEMRMQCGAMRTLANKKAMREVLSIDLQTHSPLSTRLLRQG